MIHKENLTASIVIGVIAILLLIMGILIKYFKYYWLIAGYNTATKEEKENYDIKGVSSVVGETVIMLAVCLGLAALCMLYKQILIYIVLVFGSSVTSVISISMRIKKFKKHSIKTSDSEK